MSTEELAAAPVDSWWSYVQWAAHEVYTYSAAVVDDPRGPPGPIPPEQPHPTCGPSRAQFDAFWGQS